MTLWEGPATIQDRLQKEMEERKRSRHQLTEEEQQIVNLLSRPEWAVFQKYVVARADMRKRSLYADEHSGKEFRVGRMIGWLSAAEYILQLPTSLLKQQEKLHEGHQP